MTFPLPVQIPEDVDIREYYDRKAAHLVDLKAGPQETLEITLPKPVAEHLREIAQIYGLDVSGCVLRWIYASYRTPEEKSEEKRLCEERNKLDWVPL